MCFQNRNQIVLGPVLPHKYFLASGKGESDISTSSSRTESVTYEPNSNDIATLHAGIPNVNLIELSSILPPSAKEEDPRLDPKTQLPFGAVLGAIKVQENGGQGTRLTAAIFIIELSSLREYKKGEHSWEVFGNFVTEYGGQATLPQGYKIMFKELLEMIKRRNYGDFKSLQKNINQTSKKENFKVPTEYFYSDTGTFRFRIKNHLGESFLAKNPMELHWQEYSFINGNLLKKCSDLPLFPERSASLYIPPTVFKLKSNFFF